MILTVKPTPVLKGTIQLPASKSYSIRAFIIAACGGESVLSNLSDCDDAVVSMDVAKSLGAQITRFQSHCFKVKIQNVGRLPSKINVKESGTVLRFLLPILALHSQKITVIGQGTLKGRPNHFLTRTLREMGSCIKGEGKDESVPIQIHGGGLRGGKIEIDGSLSSQFISALLIICPQLKEDTHLVLKGRKLVSADYITMTLQVLEKSGIKIQKKDERNYLIKGGQKFGGLKNFVIPSDYGLAAFLIAGAILTKSDVTFKGFLKDELLQADGKILSFLRKMGVRLEKTATSINVKGPQELKGGKFSLKDCPDLVPIMAVLSLFATGKTVLTNIQHARVKESDRISDLRSELLKIGAKIEEEDNALVIFPQQYYEKNCLFDPHNDHRLAMAFCVLGLKLGACVKDIECCAKSYPGFVRDFQAMGARLEKG